MRASTVLALAWAAAVEAYVQQGFNYGATHTDGSAVSQSEYEALFNRAKNLPGTSGFTSARLYTMIQTGTQNTPIAAIPAAINTQTGLLLGLWASAGQSHINDEIAALTNAINQYGSSFTQLIQGISVGSEDLYRVSPTGIENNSGYGASPDEIVSYINQVRQAISGTAAKGASIGHVDTWTAWVNGSNSAVNDAVDWLGVDTYPYFQNTESNSIENGESLFWAAIDATKSHANGKEVWITETGWPVSGKTENLAVASVQNAETYWQQVACSLIGKYNTYWYTLQDAFPTTPSPSFGIIGSDLNSAPLYNLTCQASSSSSSSAAASSSTSASSATVAGSGSASTTSASSASSTSGSSSSSGGASSSGSSSSSSPSGTSSSSGSSSSGSATSGSSSSSSSGSTGVAAGSGSGSSTAASSAYPSSSSGSSSSGSSSGSGSSGSGSSTSSSGSSGSTPTTQPSTGAGASTFGAASFFSAAVALIAVAGLF